MPDQYRFRYFFDTGSGICLWSDNDAARRRFGYAVDVENLPLPESVCRRSVFVTSWYDTFMDWENAPEPSPWAAREESAFKFAAQELLLLFREHLSQDFEIIDESGTTR